jgi:hypothetical protein
MKLRLEYGTWHLPTLSQKQLGKYSSKELFPASTGIMPIFFQEICIQQGARNYFLYLLGIFPYDNFYLHNFKEI